MEVTLPALARSKVGVAEDQMIPVLLRLNELSRRDGTLVGLHTEGEAAGVVFSPHPGLMGLLPTWTSQGTLLGMGGLDFGSASQKQQKELLHMYLYYCEANVGRFREYLNGTSDDSYMNFYAPKILFGHERIVSMLTLHFKPIQQHEIEDEAQAYQAYTDSFSREQASQRPLTYVVTRVESEPDMSNIDRWYERDAGERVGAYKLYHTKLRE